MYLLTEMCQRTFHDQEFVDACSELETPNTDGWEFFTESHDVRIYRLYNDVRICKMVILSVK